jgi:peptidoglycan/xylan/chitin deacetylase (PgdA/CDA1 family)
VHGAKSLFAAAALRTGVLRAWHRGKGPHVLVLAFHRVTPEAELAACAYPAMHVSTRSFEAQLLALRELYRIVPMRELQAILSGQAPLDGPVAVITFDDGYRDNYQHALPILVRLGIPATFFLSWGFVDGGQGFWFDRLADAARAWDTDAAARDRLAAVLPVPVAAALAGSGSFQMRLRAATAMLKTVPDAERERLVDAAAVAAGGGAAAAWHSEPLRWDEVAAMQAAGMRMAAHGVRHGILTRMAPETAADEIRKSVTAIGQRTGTAIEEFAYPNGDTDDTVTRLASEAGVQLGFTMRHDHVRPGDDRLRLARRNVCEDTSRGAGGQFSKAYFWCEITGLFDRVLGRGRRVS